MATRTYRISLIGEADYTEEALRALDALFAGEALDLLAQKLAASNLDVQRLSGDEGEVALFLAPTASPTLTQAAEPLMMLDTEATGEVAATRDVGAADTSDASAADTTDGTTTGDPASHGGGGGMSSEPPPP